MLKRKTIYLLMASTMLALPIQQFVDTNCVAYASQVNAHTSISDIEKIFNSKRENVDFAKYIEPLKNHFDNTKSDTTSDDFLVTCDLLTKASIETLDRDQIKDLISEIEVLKFSDENYDSQARISSNLIRLYRSLGDTKKANAIQKVVKDNNVSINDKINLARVYFYQAHGDVIDIKMKKSTVDNLKESISILEKINSAEAKELLLLAYIDLSQVELYFNKDATVAVENLELASKIANELNNPYFSNVVNELESHTLPFFLKYEEGIAALRPVINYYESNGFYSEAYRGQHKLVTLMFDSGSPDALKEGEKLDKLLNKIQNTSKKDYYLEYCQPLYLANVNAVNGTFEKGIDILSSKNFSKFDHIYGIDYSVTNMYLGNLYTAIEKPKKALEHFELMMKAIVENSNDNAFVYTDTTSYLGQAYYNLGMYKEGYEVLQKHITDYVNYDMNINKRNTEELSKKYDLERSNAQILELELKHERESYKSTMFLVIMGGLVIGLGFLIRERKKIREYNKKLAKLSTTDGLTGLANRRSLDEFLGAQSKLLLQLNKTEQEQLYVSAIMIDIDFFKKYNDNYGHVKGDSVLQQVGDTLASLKSSNDDIIARYGGEEFAIVLTNTDKAQALNIASKINTTLSEAAIPHGFSEVSDIVTVSIGVSTKNILTDSLDSLISDADKALYYSKTHGRNTFTHFDDCK